MGFDDAFIQSDQSAFAEMGAAIIFNGRTIQAVSSPISSYQTQHDGSGGFQRSEGAQVEVLSSDMIGAGTIVGLLVVIPGGSSYRVQQVKSNGYTTTLILGSTAGTSPQF